MLLKLYKGSIEAGLASGDYVEIAGPGKVRQGPRQVKDFCVKQSKQLAESPGVSGPGVEKQGRRRSVCARKPEAKFEM